MAKQLTMSLKDYIQSGQATYSGLAREIPCSQPHIWDIANGKANPSFKMACRIENVTSGIVPRTLWYPND